MLHTVPEADRPPIVTTSQPTSGEAAASEPFAPTEVCELNGMPGIDAWGVPNTDPAGAFAMEE